MELLFLFKGRRIIQKCPSGAFCRYDVVADRVNCVFSRVPAHVNRPISTVATKAHGPIKVTAQHLPKKPAYKLHPEATTRSVPLPVTPKGNQKWCDDLKKAAKKFCGDHL